MPQIPESSSSNWDSGPIYDVYADDEAGVVQALEAFGVQDYSADHLHQVRDINPKLHDYRLLTSFCLFVF